MEIAICITTRNRHEILRRSLSEWNDKLPKNARIFIVDDASREIPKDIHLDYRFRKNAGIAKSKNKCLELAEGFEHIFLVDDDIYPIVNGWEKPYINSSVNHLCFSFQYDHKGRQRSKTVFKNGYYEGLISYNAPNGCMLYLNKICIEKVGGMRTEFGAWGYEHYEYSQRIHNLGLTSLPFLDVENSLELFHSMDYFGEVESSVPSIVRSHHIQRNKELLKKYFDSTDFVKFK